MRIEVVTHKREDHSTKMMIPVMMFMNMIRTMIESWKLSPSDG